MIWAFIGGIAFGLVMCMCVIVPVVYISIARNRDSRAKLEAMAKMCEGVWRMYVPSAADRMRAAGVPDGNKSMAGKAMT